tara:strand:- start:278 stop:757 length:480 start_codon:yes stop_codon:yes gene_type:complete
MKKKLVLGLGSNLGNRYSYLMQALWELEFEIETKATCARFYETPPWGDTNQAKYINTVIAFDTQKSIDQCFTIVQAVEQRMGRKRERKWGPRNIDIDILFYDDLIAKTNTLEVPHPEIINRSFVLVPLCDLMPNFEHPKTKGTMHSFLNSLEDDTTLFI